jgi:hypothetical protein
MRMSLSGSDDPLSLEFMINVMQQRFPMANINELEFDIYQEPRLGATLVTPHGWSVKAVDQLLPNGMKGLNAGVPMFPDIAIIAVLADLNDPFRARQASGAATTGMLQSISRGCTWFPDAQLSYGVNPMTGELITWVRPDGVAYTRKAWTRACFNQWNGMWDPTGHVFETHLVKRGAIFVAVIASDIAPGPRAMIDNMFAKQWMSAIIAVHLSTFSGG